MIADVGSNEKDGFFFFFLLLRERQDAEKV